MFEFGGKRWNSRVEAQRYFNLSNVGRLPQIQRQFNEAEQRLAEQAREIETLRRALGPASSAVGQGQGTANGQAPPPGPHGFAEKFVKSGDLEFITGLLQDSDPQVGVQKFTVALLDRVDREMNERLEQVRSEEIQPILRQRQFEQHMGSAMGAARNLAQPFPELDNENHSPEAEEHQQAFVENLKQFPPEFTASNPEFAMLAAALVTRYQHGTPILAQAPGTSGSPSARAALASEQAYAAATGTPIDGSGTPRPRLDGGGETPLDRIRRENAAAPGNFRTPSGKDLGFGPA